MSEYTISDGFGKQRPISELSDQEIRKLMWRTLPNIQKAVYHFLKVREEWAKRELDAPGRFLKYDAISSIEHACQDAVTMFDTENEESSE